MDKKTKALLLLFVIGLVLLFALNKSGKVNTDKQSIIKPSGTVESDQKNVELPAPIKGKNTVTVIALYFFEAPVKEFTQEQEGYKLVLDTTNKDIPQFKVTETAKILQLAEGENGSHQNPVPAKIEDIQKGSIVQVGANYNLITNHWSVGGITVLDH